MKKFDQLETLFQHITNDDVYNVNPLTKKGNLKKLNILWKSLNSVCSLGETKNLRELLEQMLTKEEYQMLKHSNKELFCVTTNFEKQKDVVKSTEKENYSDMLDWIWASASVPILMKPIEKNGQTWVDGGLIDNSPVDHAFQRGIRYIDVICLYPEQPRPFKKKYTLGNISSQLLHTMFNSNHLHSVQAAQLMAKFKGDFQIHYFYMSISDAEYLSNLYSFDHKILADGFNRGYQAFKKHPFPHQVFKNKLH